MRVQNRVRELVVLTIVLVLSFSSSALATQKKLKSRSDSEKGGYSTKFRVRDGSGRETDGSRPGKDR